MKKGKRGLVFLVLFILMFSLTFASASLFGDLWNKITGRTITGCTDTDSGNDPYSAGTCTDWQYPSGISDYCQNLQYNTEAYCYDDGNENGPYCSFAVVSCSGGCENGECKQVQTQNISITGKCGSSNGQTLTSEPITNLCDAGNSGSVSFDSSVNKWKWNCNGVNGGGTLACTSTKYVAPPTSSGSSGGGSSSTAIKGVCGNASGKNSATQPTSDLCNAGYAGSVSFNSYGNNWVWYCLGYNNGGNSLCTASKSIGSTPTNVINDSSTSQNNSINDSESNQIINPICGNNLIETGEECDDGNLVGDDGCSSNCVIETIPTFTPEWICMDSFNKAYRESDGNLKDKTFCPAGCENAECNLESYCNELIVGHNNIEENRINIIFIGFNFNTINEVKDITNTYVNQLTSHEPFNSNKDKFNYWYINQLPKVDNPLTSYISGLAGGFEMGLKSNELSSLCLFQNKQVVNIGNWLFTSNFGGRSMRISAYDTRDIVFSHEFGHSFGGLEDEYLAFNSFAYYDSPGTMNCDSYNPETGVACPKWCKGIAKPIEEFEKVDCSSITDPISCSNINPCMYINTFGKTGCVNAITMCKEITDKSACELNKLCEWKDNVRSITTEAYYGFKSNCISSVSPLRDSNIGTDCIEGTGCYQICGSRNLYKAAHHSIMDVLGSPPYNTFNNIHIKFLCIQLKDQTGSVGGICTTKFGIT